MSPGIQRAGKSRAGRGDRKIAPLLRKTRPSHQRHSSSQPEIHPQMCTQSWHLEESCTHFRSQIGHSSFHGTSIALHNSSASTSCLVCVSLQILRFIVPNNHFFSSSTRTTAEQFISWWFIKSVQVFVVFFLIHTHSPAEK